MQASTLLAVLSILFLAVTLGCASTPAGAPTAGELVDVDWACVKIDGRPVPVEAEVTVRFEADGRAGGGTGVNRWFGTWTTLGEGDLEVSSLGTTRRAGPPELMQLEQRFLEALGQVERSRLDGGRLLLLKGGQTLLELTR